MNKLSLIVPIYKNEGNIEPFYADFCRNIKPYLDDYEIIMVDDRSPDHAWEAMRELAHRDNRIRLVRLSRNFGAVAASYTGIQYSKGDCVTVKACDLQEPAEVTVEMYQKWKGGAKTVIAVREGREDPLAGRFFSAVYYWLIRRLVIDSMPKGGFDTYLVDHRVAERIIDMNDRNSPITIQLLWMGFDIQKIYYVRRKRKIGRSSWTFSKKVKLFVDSFMGFSYVPIRIMSIAGMLFALFAIIYGIKIIIARLHGEIDVRGYTAIFVVVLFSAGMIMSALGLLGEYVWRTLDAARHRPMSVVDELVNFEGEYVDEKNHYHRQQ